MSHCLSVFLSLRRRHDSVIASLYDGTQCSSCGLRFPGEAAKIYREHLDWHFRKNRREKDGRRVAHRQWYFVVKDWLNYEEISDPDERGSVLASPSAMFSNFFFFRGTPLNFSVLLFLPDGKKKVKTRKNKHTYIHTNENN